MAETGPLVPYDCSEDEVLDEDDDEEDDATPQLPQEQTPCDFDEIGGRLPGGSVYLPFLKRNRRKIRYDINACNRLLGHRLYTDAEIEEMENDVFDTDDELLNWEWTHWRVFDDPNRLELYHIRFEHEDECVESKCLEMLRQIDCEKRFSCCSIEIPGVFFAWLWKDEAEKLEGLTGIRDCLMRRKTFFMDKP